MTILAAIDFVLYMLLWAYPQIRHERNVAEEERKKEIVARDEATEQRNIAVAEEQRAVAAEQKAERQLNEIIRLSDLTRLSSLEAESNRLWPAYPGKIDDLEGWQARAEELLGRLEIHRLTLEALREKALPYDEAARQQDRESHPAWSDLNMARFYRKNLAARIVAIEKGGAVIEGIADASIEGKVSREELESMKQMLAGTDREIADRSYKHDFRSLEILSRQLLLRS